MGRACTVCVHPAVGSINDLLRSGRSARSVAAEFTLGDRAMLRHAHGHLHRLSHPPDEAIGSDPLDELTASLRLRALSGDVAAAREYRLALQAQAARNVTAPAVNLTETPEWIELRTAILEALEPHPAARWAVADVLADR